MTRLATRWLPLALIAPALGLTGCDSIFGPTDNPDRIEIRAERYTLDILGDTVRLDAVVEDEAGDRLPEARVTWESRTPAVAMIDGAGTLTARSNGVVWIVARSGAAVDSVSFTIASPITCAPVGELTVPTTVSAALEPSDCRQEDRYTDAWRLRLESRRQVTFLMRSDELDGLLVLFDSEGTPLGYDDGVGGSAARITATLDPGQYFLYAGSFNRGQTGTYALTVIDGLPPSPCPAAAVVSFPDTVSGAVGPDDCTFNGFYLDVWRLELERDAVVTLQVDSEQLEPAVILADTLGTFLYSSTVGAAPGSVWLEVTLAAGAYDIWLGSENEPQRAGDYTLSLRPGPTALRCAARGAVAPTQTVTGSLDPDDCFLFVGPAEGWEVELTDTTALGLALASDDFTPLILISDSTGALLTEIFNGTPSVRTEIQLLPGRYRVWAVASDNRHGSYTLSVSIAGQLPACDPVGALAVGDTVAGALASDDCPLPGGYYADPWTVRLDTASTVTVSLDSDKLDPFLVIADSTGARIARDDDGGGDANAALTLSLDAGLYQLWATSYAPDTIGAYRLGVVEAVAGTGAGAALRDTATTKPGRTAPPVAPRPRFPPRPGLWGGTRR